jgi:alpha-N-arabinofuranosidase
MTDSSLYSHRDGAGTEATVRVDPDVRGTPVEPNLFGKFAEHLGQNVDGGMHAQVLINPTFGPWEFPADDGHRDGGIEPEYDEDAIARAIRDHCADRHLPNPDELFDAYGRGAAFGWVPAGDGVRTTPDVSPEGDRAQRVVLDGGGGLLQRTYLPLHRTDTYEATVRLRATEPTPVTLGVYEREADPFDADPVAALTVDADGEWATHEATLVVNSSAPDDAVHTVALTADSDADLVVDRATLYPDDSVGRADPEVVAYLREADLPLLRWPGGNFVSGYRWRDGVGPADERPSRVNPAWGRCENNLFGTAEFVEFCEAVGCDPMICVNAGDGTPEEAARWVEYCNGSTDTEMGALRAEHGYPEPFDVRYWEIGNELFGKWQVGWTTPSGNADRYLRFRDAMREADPDISVQACGNRNSPGDRWNETLIEEAGTALETVTDHILTGGAVDAATDPRDLFHAFMGYAPQLGREYRDLRRKMRDAGIEDPRLAITELQLFAHFGENRELEHHGALLSPEEMPSRTTVSEPLYFATIVHECARIGEFVEMLTHSATVNHGGGLQQKRGRTWPDPAHYGHVLLSAVAGGTPVGVAVTCDTIETRESFGDIEAFDDVPVVDAFAVEHADEYVVTLVNRHGADEDVELTLDVSSLDVSSLDAAEVTTLTADAMHRENTYDDPDRVVPETREVPIERDELAATLPSYSLVRVTVGRE